MRSSQLGNKFTLEMTELPTFDGPSGKRGGFPWIPAILLLLLGTVLFRIASGGRSFDFDRFWGSIRNLHPGYCLLAILFIILSYVGRAVRWEVMMRPLGAKAPFRRMLAATAIGFTAVVLLGRAGEFVRPWLIAKESKTSFPAQMAVWFFERIYDLLVVILFFGCGLVHLASNGRVSQAGDALRTVVSSGGWAALAGGLVCLGFIFALRFFSADQREKFAQQVDRLPAKLAAKLKPLTKSFLDGAAASCDGSLQWRVMLYTFLEWVVIAACQWCIFMAFPVTRHLTVPDLIAIVGLVSFGAVVQLPGIGGGMQVAAVAVLTQLFGVGIEEATSVALVLWAASFTLVVPVGVALALKEGLRFGQMGKLSGEET